MKPIINSSFFEEDYETEKEIAKGNNIVCIYELSKPKIKKSVFLTCNFYLLKKVSLKKHFSIYYIINISSFLIYYLCLKGCPYEITIWVDDNWQKLYYIEASCILIIGLIISLEYTFITLNLKGFKHIIYNSISYVCMFNYFGNGKTFRSHEGINKYLFLSAFLFFFIFFFIIGILIKVTLKYKYAKKMMIAINIIIIIIVLLKSVFFLKKGDCNSWIKGINGTYIDNSEIFDSCFMKIPKSYKLGIYLNFLGHSKELLPDCKSDKR